MRHLTASAVIMILLCTVSSAQSRYDHSSESTSVTIGTGKISSKLDKAVNFVKAEMKQFRQEWDESLTPEEKRLREDAKKNVKEGLQYAREAVHQGWRQGLRGEPYTSPSLQKKEESKRK